MSVASRPPKSSATLDDLARRLAKVEEQLRQGLAHGLDDHVDVDLQRAAAGSALARGAGAIWVPGATGGPTITLSCSTASVAPPGATLEWTPPEVNVGDAFSYDAGFPDAVTVVASSLLLVTVHLKVAPVDSTWQRLILSGFGSGAASTEMVQHESGDASDTPEMVRLVQANAGVALEVMLDHNGSLAMPITKGDWTVTRLWSL